MANRMRMLSVADSCEPVAERPYGEWLTISISQRLQDRTYATVKIVAEPSIQYLPWKKYPPYYAVCALRNALTWLAVSTRAIRFHSVPHSPLILYSIAKRDVTPLGARSLSFSLFLSLSAFFYSAHRLDRAPMQTRKLDRILGIIISSGKCRRSASFISRTHGQKADRLFSIITNNIRIFVEAVRNYLTNFSHIYI